MPTERWQRLEQLFGEALDLSDAARAELLARECGPDAGLKREVLSLLSAAERSGDFLARPALQVFAQEISQNGWSVRAGDQIRHYTIERRLGAGGMGEVWRARDQRLGRDVAIKLLLPHPSNTQERARAFEQEARAVGSLNHVNVVTVHDVGEHRGAPYLVTECLEGHSLRVLLSQGALTLDAALDIAVQVARGLCAAHERGIVHRDLKPENVFLTFDGRAKILDFGLATQSHPRSKENSSMVLAGTAGYMAPEQFCGEAVDARADIFAFGVILHEMLTGRRPPSSAPSMPPAVAQPALQSSTALLQRCLAPAPSERFATASELVAELESLQRSRAASWRHWVAQLRRPVVLLGAVLALLALGVGAWQWRLATSERWARSVAPPEVQRLLSQGELPEAFLLARRALDLAPDEPLLKRLWLDVSIPATIHSDPPGADVALAPYTGNVSSWFLLGRTPLVDVRIPRGLFRLRVSKAGFEPIEGTGAPGALARYRLDAQGAVPAGMVRVVGGRAPARFGLKAELDDFWIDRFEVTNRQFEAFVARGGYQKREYWREAFVADGRAVSWEDALQRFRDSSGDPGPATWREGRYPEGQAEFPVAGVSWYEAAAYAAYAGKSLPTLYHWYQAAALGRFADILTVSNFGGKGPAAVGSHPGLGPFGTFDMAGNVREWAWNEMGQERFLLGGAWNDALRMFANADVKGPFERAANSGFRLVQYTRPLAPAVAAPVELERLGRDVRKLHPVSDEIYDVYRRQFAYDSKPLNVEVEENSDGEDWRRQSVSFDAAYGGERLRAYLIVPRNVPPPYQTVVFFPPGDAFVLKSTREMSVAWAEPMVRSGRAFVYPVYKGTYERRSAPGKMGANEQRERRIAWSRDLGRTLDYLATRPDVDPARLAFYAVGAGASAVLLTALEPRFNVAVLQGSGISIWGDVAPEIDAIHYAPRVRVPTLMLNARYDFDNPVETAQRPLFELLGTPAEHKQHTVLEVGHGIPIQDSARAILPWLDRYLGSARPAPASAAIGSRGER